MSEAADRRGRGASLGVGADHAAASRIAALEKIVEQYKVLLETSAAITTSTDLEETLGLITSLVTERLDVAWCDLYDYEAVADEFVVIAFYQLPELRIDSSEWIGTRYDSSKWSDLDACVKERRPSISYRDDPELPARELANMDEWEELSNMRLPLVYRGAVIGLIDVGESRTMRRWTDDDKRVLQAIADQAAIAIVNARAYAALAEQAVTDGLTGLFNHRHFSEHLRQEVTTARRYGQELSLMMVDVDDFKAFNDRHGHPQGDRVLAEVADILRQGTRTDVDILARYGGDEFMVILPQARANGLEPTAARNVAERIAATIRAHEFESVKGRRDVAMTVSIGVAGIGLGGYTHEELLSSADKALYLAKHQGKDRVSVFGT
ncbi:MAG: sensor domain-containing diguanylate cyclase [Actinomycetes bacterium]